MFQFKNNIVLPLVASLAACRAPEQVNDISPIENLAVPQITRSHSALSIEDRCWDTYQHAHDPSLIDEAISILIASRDARILDVFYRVVKEDKSGWDKYLLTAGNFFDFKSLKDLYTFGLNTENYSKISLKALAQNKDSLGLEELKRVLKGFDWKGEPCARTNCFELSNYDLLKALQSYPRDAELIDLALGELESLRTGSHFSALQQTLVAMQHEGRQVNVRAKAFIENESPTHAAITLLVGYPQSTPDGFFYNYIRQSKTEHGAGIYSGACAKTLLSIGYESVTNDLFSCFEDLEHCFEVLAAACTDERARESLLRELEKLCLYENVSAQAFSMAQQVLDIHQRAEPLNIYFPLRAKPYLMDRVLSEREHSTMQTEKSCLMLLPVRDHNGAFSDLSDPIKKLYDAGFVITWFELGRGEESVEHQFVEALKSQAQIKSNCDAHRPFHIIIPIAHSTEGGMQFRDGGWKGRLGIEDEAFIVSSGAYTALAFQGEIVVVGCSIGKGLRENKNNFANMLRRIFYQAKKQGIYSFEGEDNIRTLELMDDGKIEYVVPCFGDLYQAQLILDTEIVALLSLKQAA